MESGIAPQVCQAKFQLVLARGQRKPAFVPKQFVLKILELRFRETLRNLAFIREDELPIRSLNVGGNKNGIVVAALGGLSHREIFGMLQAENVMQVCVARTVTKRNGCNVEILFPKYHAVGNVFQQAAPRRAGHRRNQFFWSVAKWAVKSKFVHRIALVKDDVEKWWNGATRIGVKPDLH